MLRELNHTPDPNEPTVRVLRVIEYEGPRSWVDKQLANSIHGERRFTHDPRCVIRAATLGVVPTILIPPAAPGKDAGNADDPGQHD